MRHATDLVRRRSKAMIANGRDINLEGDEGSRALPVVTRGIRIHTVNRSSHVRPPTCAVRHRSKAAEIVEVLVAVTGMLAVLAILAAMGTMMRAIRALLRR